MSELIDRLSAALADRYRIERELGHGGMATVWLADDLRHHRRVAIKVLRPELAAALGAERFLREIDTTAALRHPHILPLYDSGDADGVLFYVMPLVEGESLRERLDREKQLPLDDALQIAREVADALSYAHSRGIIHRDIKPENILLESGHAVVADFGIARALDAAGGETLTATGMAVGTPRYMSPEQAGGERNVDGRSDLYSLACVLYEMLAGQPPFTGPTVESVVHQHLTAEAAPVSRFRPAVPAEVVGTLQRALAKVPADRFNPVAQFSDALRHAVAPHEPRRPARRWGRAVAVAGAVVAIPAAAMLVWRARAPVLLVPGDTRQITIAPGLEIDPAISPDGQLIAWSAGPLGAMQIYVRRIGGGAPVALTGGAGDHRYPQWSPDGARVAYQADSAIWAVSALGGAPQRLVAIGTDSIDGFSWSPDGARIAYVAGFSGRIWIAEVAGGAPRAVTSPSFSSEVSWSPDGSRLAYVDGNAWQRFGGASVFGNLSSSTIKVVGVDAGTPIPITTGAAMNVSPVWAPDGRSLYWVSSQDGSRDINQIAVDAAGRPVGRRRRLTTGLGAQSISLSADGHHLAWSAFRHSSNIWRVPIAGSGERPPSAAQPLTTGNQVVEDLDVDRAGSWLAFNSNRSGTSDIYRMPAGGGEIVQLTTDSADDFDPAWSPDGRLIAFHSLRTGNRDLFVMDADGRNQRRLTSDPHEDVDANWSPDGRHLIYVSFGLGRPFTLYELALDDSAPPKPLGPGVGGRWSPVTDDIIYVTDDTLWTRRISGGATRVLATGSGGLDRGPRWPAYSWDGRTVYFLNDDARGPALWAVPAAGGAPRRVIRFTDPLHRPTQTGIAAGKDFVYLTVGSPESDVWVMDLRKP